MFKICDQDKFHARVISAWKSFIIPGPVQIRDWIFNFFFFAHFKDVQARILIWTWSRYSSNAKYKMQKYNIAYCDTISESLLLHNY